MADNLGSDGNNSPTVSVTAGAAKGGNDSNVGKHKAVFASKTKLTKPKNFEKG